MKKPKDICVISIIHTIDEYGLIVLIEEKVDVKAPTIVIINY